MTLSSDAVGYVIDPANEDWTGMAAQGEEAAAQAALDRLPRCVKVRLELIPSFRHRTVVVWDVDAEVPPALTAAETTAAVKEEVLALTAAVKRVLEPAKAS